MRTPRAMAALVVMGVSLAGCAGERAADPSPAVTHSREVASTFRCLVDHSPWTLDLDTVYREWYAAASTDHELAGGSITGSAELSFTRGEVPRWKFTASGVSYELFFSGGARETTTFSRQLSGGYALPEPGGILTLTSVREAANQTDAATLAEDGTRTEGTSVAAPRFPWDGNSGTQLALTCTEHRLVVSAPGETPDTWNLSPG